MTNCNFKVKPSLAALNSTVMKHRYMRSSGVKETLKRKFNFRWEVLDVIIGGKSTIDSVTGFYIPTLEAAEHFIRNYGFDLENPIEKAHVQGHFYEALHFIKRYFLFPDNSEGARLEIPKRIHDLTDVRELFLMACYRAPNQLEDSHGTNLRNWACSVLKVMHTVAHLDQDLRAPYFPEVQKQILDRFYKHVRRDETGKLYLGDRDTDPNRVDLVAFETKPKKSRDSTLIKLLHKPENVAEDIFDRVGLRFVTPTRLGALQVIKYLKDQMIIISPNIKPSRSRNSLINMDEFKVQLADFLAHQEANLSRVLPQKLPELLNEQMINKLEAAAIAQVVSPENPHSSEFYRAIQFTGRQLIKLKNPLYEDLRNLKVVSKSKVLDDDLQKALDRIDLKHLQKEVRFFYPFEVQVVDEASAHENERGVSAHGEYKRAQLQTAMKRVLGVLMARQEGT